MYAIKYKMFFHDRKIMTDPFEMCTSTTVVPKLLPCCFLHIYWISTLRVQCWIYTIGT